MPNAGDMPICATRNLLELRRQPTPCWLGLPVFGQRCRRSDDAEGGDSCASQSAGAAYWIDLQQFQQSHTPFGIYIESAVTFGMHIAFVPLWRNVNGQDG
jgi:hypothetical protein